MVIFHSYVSLPEGNKKINKDMDKLKKQNMPDLFKGGLQDHDTCL